MTLCNIDSVWDWLAPILHKMEGFEGDPIAVWRACSNGKALCFRCADGVTIVYLAPGPGHVLELVVWLAVSLGPKGAVDRNLPALEEVARELTAKRLVFYSPRRGWDRSKLFHPEERHGKKAYVREVE